MVEPISGALIASGAGSVAAEVAAATAASEASAMGAGAFAAGGTAIAAEAAAVEGTWLASVAEGGSMASSTLTLSEASALATGTIGEGGGAIAAEAATVDESWLASSAEGGSMASSAATARESTTAVRAGPIEPALGDEVAPLVAEPARSSWRASGVVESPSSRSTVGRPINEAAAEHVGRVTERATGSEDGLLPADAAGRPLSYSERVQGLEHLDVRGRMREIGRRIWAEPGIPDHEKRFHISPALRELEDVPGAHDVAQKLLIDNSNVRHGHLAELNHGRQFKQQNFEVLRMDLPVETRFGRTDIDLLVRSPEGEVTALESKRWIEGVSNSRRYFQPKIDKLSDLVGQSWNGVRIDRAAFVNYSGGVSDGAREYARQRGVQVIAAETYKEVPELIRRAGA